MKEIRKVIRNIRLNEKTHIRLNNTLVITITIIMVIVVFVFASVFVSLIFKDSEQLKNDDFSTELFLNVRDSLSRFF